MARTKNCSKCQGSMTVGWIVDNTYGKRGISGWIEGEPQKSFWTGVKLGGRKPIDIETWRCSRCGFLENYAPGTVS